MAYVPSGYFSAIIPLVEGTSGFAESTLLLVFEEGTMADDVTVAVAVGLDSVFSNALLKIDVVSAFWSVLKSSKYGFRECSFVCLVILHMFEFDILPGQE